MSRLVSSFLFAVTATDPFIYASSVLMLLLMALFASLLPAIRNSLRLYRSLLCDRLRNSRSCGQRSLDQFHELPTNCSWMVGNLGKNRGTETLDGEVPLNQRVFALQIEVALALGYKFLTTSTAFSNCVSLPSRSASRDSSVENGRLIPSFSNILPCQSDRRQPATRECSHAPP